MKKKNRSTISPLAIRPLKFQMDKQSEEVRVEIVPLIDVIFCILTFFILAAVGLSRQQAISVDLPKATTGTRQGREILMVYLNEFGQLFVEQEPVATQEEFIEQLQAYNRANPRGVMALSASSSATYNQVVQVLDVLREVGGERVALATLPTESIQIPNVFPGLPSTGVPNYTPNPVNPPNSEQPQLPGLPELLLPESNGTQSGEE
ncbi:MAG: biopolymer transporter ExbD [Coleofasciculaceae cyanobacterium]